MITFISLLRFNPKEIESPSDVEKYCFKNFFFYIQRKPHTSGSNIVFTKHLTSLYRHFCKSRAKLKLIFTNSIKFSLKTVIQV